MRNLTLLIYKEKNQLILKRFNLLMYKKSNKFILQRLHLRFDIQ